MRRPFTYPSNFITRDIMGLTRPSLVERYTNLTLVFLCSSLYHVIVDLLQSVPIQNSGSIPFFMAFIPAIMIEDCVQWLRKQCSPPRALNWTSQKSKPPGWQRALGFCWVMGWLAVSSTWYLTPMNQSTSKEIYMVPFSFCRLFGMMPMATSCVCSGVILMYVFEVEI